MRRSNPMVTHREGPVLKVQRFIEVKLMIAINKRESESLIHFGISLNELWLDFGPSSALEPPHLCCAYMFSIFSLSIFLSLFAVTEAFVLGTEIIRYVKPEMSWYCSSVK